MSVLPAVDLRDGACVQLVGGSYDEERVRLDDPVGVAARWFDSGLELVHVVDLDAATGNGDNRAVLTEMLRRWPGRLQIGGGIRSTGTAEELLGAGAARVIVGTRGLADPDWLARLTSRFADRVILAVDVREREVVTHGWQRGSGVPIGDVLDTVAPLPLAGLLVTAVHVEGALQGPDVELMTEVRGRSLHRLQAAGGIRNAEDVRALTDAGVEDCVVGMALYTGAFELPIAPTIPTIPTVAGKESA